MATTSRAEQRRRAYEAGFRGDPTPEWINDPDVLDEYDRGLNDHETGGVSPPPSSARRAAHSGGSSSSRSTTRRRGTGAGSSTSSTPPAPAPDTSAAAQNDWLKQTKRARAAAGNGPRVEDGRSNDPTGSDLPAAHFAGVSVNDGAGFILGLVVFALVRAFLAGGSTEAKEWLAAKFLNHPGTKAATSSGATGSKTAPASPDTTTTAPASPDTTRTVPGNYVVSGQS
jgi:hypothetical protein